MANPGLRKVSIKENNSPYKWHIIRWSFVLLINFFFFASFYFDIQLLEGTLSGSRLFGFHLADPFAAIQTMFASKVFNTNLIIGAVTIGVFYLLFGGRSFCSWVCPFHFIAEMNDYLKKYLKNKNILQFKQHTFDRKLKYIIFFLFIALATLSGLTIFEIINPVSALSRAFVYGPGVVLIFVIGLLVFELLFSRRGWCRFFCPVGVSYILLGFISPLKIHWNNEKCSNCKDCQKVCMVPHVLTESVNKGKTTFVVSGECTRCGLCIDACDDGALKYKTKYLDKLI
ncbi:MAG: quinol dehydrogenase ferredoxin subunit NapH [Bdellovibrionaceae bacterium]|nr:quinol dehydrogenase ferredoxin subunit NapH [Pseudobdellovibrionaceae bacterium]